MNLNDLNELQNRVNRHRQNAEGATKRAKVAASIRTYDTLQETVVDLKIPNWPSYEAVAARARIQDMVRGHLPTMLRTIELEELATAKRESMAADLLEAQIRAAIVTTPVGHNE